MVGIELSEKEGFDALLERFDESRIDYRVLEPDDAYYSLLL